MTHIILQPEAFQYVAVWISSGLPCIGLYLNVCLPISDKRKIPRAPDIPEGNLFEIWEMLVMERISVFG